MSYAQLPYAAAAVVALAAPVICAAQWLVEYQGKQHYEVSNPLPPWSYKTFDLGHRLLPRVEDKPQPFLCKMYNLVPLVLGLAVVWSGTPAVWKFLRVYVAVMFVRAITMSVTILPKDKHCTCLPEGDHLAWVTNGCYDKNLSGHMALAVVASLVLYEAGAIPGAVLVAANAWHAFIIVATRAHYTADVVLATFISLLAYLALER